MTVSLTTQLMAIGLTVSQLATAPAKNFQRHFDPKDVKRVAQILHDGCAAFAKDPEDPTKPLDIVGLIELAAEDKDAPAAPGAPAAPATPAPALKGMAAKFASLDWPALKIISKQICTTGVVPDDSPAHLPDVIAYFNETFKTVDDISFLKNFHPPSSNLVKDGNEHEFTDMSQKDNNRTYVTLKELPAHVPQAFISAEDKMFYRHGGIDTIGIMRAAMSAIASTGKVSGGSTIPQQMIKNVSKHSEVTFERKMREMYLASLATEVLTKEQIMEIYLNIIPLGRGTVGLGMAAKVYFNKRASDLTISEVAALAGMNQGPDYINPDKRPKLVDQKRLRVLGRMAEDLNSPETRKHTDLIHARVARKSNQVLAAQINQARTQPPTFAARQRPSNAYYFVDEVKRQVRRLTKEKPELANFDQGGFVVHSTIDPKIQRAVTLSLQDGLANLEHDLHRAKFTGPVGSIAERMKAFDKPWQEVLPDVKANLYYDVLWPLAVVLPKGTTAGCANGARTVGLKSKKTACLNGDGHDVGGLKDYDLIFVHSEDQAKTSVKLMVPPEIQGATVVLENQTGRVLGMSGGFSYGASQLNRATMTRRQAGSTMKPLTYLYAMNRNFQPNTLISDTEKAVTGPDGTVWDKIRNYSRNDGGVLTLRAALENSINIATVNLANAIGLPGIRFLASDLGLCDVPEAHDPRDPGIPVGEDRVPCENNFPFVLGTQPMRVIDMARAYATIGNLGQMPQEAYYVEAIEQNGRPVWTRTKSDLKTIRHADKTSFYLLRSMMAGVVERGTAAKAMKEEFAGLVAAKTGTSQHANDAWFIGVTNEYTVATWVGYDNGPATPENPKPKARTLGEGVTGGMAALPIAQRILRYLNYNEKNPEIKNLKPLSPPPLGYDKTLKHQYDLTGEAMISPRSGQFVEAGTPGAFKEVFRLTDPKACLAGRLQGREDNCQVVDKWNALLQPGDLPNYKVPTGDGDAQMPATAAGGQSTEQRVRDDGYQHYEPTTGETPVPSFVDPRVRQLQRGSDYRPY